MLIVGCDDILQEKFTNNEEKKTAQFEFWFWLPARLQHELIHIKLPFKYFPYLSLMSVHVGSDCVFPKTHSPQCSR